MFEIQITTEFAAAHALSIAGVREPVHGHNWEVVATVAGEKLDDDGLLADFHTIESALREIVGVFHNRNLNDDPAFADRNPSAELVAQHIARELSARVDAALAPHARVTSVSVTEAPNCRAVCRV